jgi:hypothetical protein
VHGLVATLLDESSSLQEYVLLVDFIGIRMPDFPALGTVKRRQDFSHQHLSKYCKTLCEHTFTHAVLRRYPRFFHRMAFIMFYYGKDAETRMFVWNLDLDIDTRNSILTQVARSDGIDIDISRLVLSNNIGTIKILMKYRNSFSIPETGIIPSYLIEEHTLYVINPACVVDQENKTFEPTYPLVVLDDNRIFWRMIDSSYWNLVPFDQDAFERAVISNSAKSARSS